MTSHAIRARSLSAWGYQHRALLIGALVALFLATVVVLWARGMDAERRALVRMPSAEHAAFYEETRTTTESLCNRAETNPALHDRCVDSAKFLVKFPECDDACRTYSRRFTVQPAR